VVSDPDSRKQFNLVVVIVLLCAVAFRAVLLLGDAFPFNADEAIVGLMADHILAGEWPVFFYGQAYMGSLDATLVAGLFALFGRAVVWIRVLQSFLYLGVIVTSMILAHRATGSPRATLGTGLLLAFPTVNATLYTTVSLGGYSEALLIGNLLLLLAFRWMDTDDLAWKSVALWGFLAGVGLWAFGLTVIYVLPTAILLGWKLRHLPHGSYRLGKLAVGVLCLLLGLSPLIVWGLNHSPQLLLDEFLGAAIRDPTQDSGLRGILNHGINLLLFGPTVILGLRAPWSTQWLAPVLSIFPLAFWSLLPASLFVKLRRRSRLSGYSLLLLGVMAADLVGFLVTPFGNDPSGRYFLPLYPLLAVAAGMVLSFAPSGRRQQQWVTVLLSGTLIFTFWTNLYSGLIADEKLTTQFDAVSRINHRYDQELIKFLIQQGEYTGYSNYWVAYPIAFQSEERLIYIPGLPYHPDLRHTQRDNRYQPYAQIVDESDRWAYITTHNPALDEWLRQALRQQGAAWEETWIGDYHIYYHVQPPLRLDALGSFD
jgi:hypothetical protein